MTDTTNTPKPILFSGPMVRAILEGRKTKTRRVMRPQPPEDCGRILVGTYHPTRVDRHGEEYPGEPVFGAYSEDGSWGQRCPYGAPGDRLWVREAWQAIHVSIDPETGHGDDVQAAPCIPKDSQNGWWGVVYAATDPQANEHREDRGFAWRPGIHMPRWASRITLEIVSVRVERLQDISGPDCWAEGIECAGWDCEKYGSVVHCYRDLWESINGPGSWERNDWVWVIGFKRVEEGESK